MLFKKVYRRYLSKCKQTIFSFQENWRNVTTRVFDGKFNYSISSELVERKKFTTFFNLGFWCFKTQAKHVKIWSFRRTGGTIQNNYFPRQVINFAWKRLQQDICTLQPSVGEPMFDRKQSKMPFKTVFFCQRKFLGYVPHTCAFSQRC